MSEPTPTTAAAIAPADARFNAEAFYVALDQVRIQRAMSWRKVRSAIGIDSSSTFTRMGRHWRNPSVDSLVRLMVWAGITDITSFIKRAGDGDE